MQRQLFGAQGRAVALRLLLLHCLILLAAACAVEQTQAIPVGDAVRIENPTARPVAVGQNGAAYFTIINPTGEDDRLLSATGAVASAIELHETRNDNGVMRMGHHAEGVPVSAHSTLPFAPGGNHVMLMDLRQPLMPGQSFTLTLTFATAGEIEVAVLVQDK